MFNLVGYAVMTLVWTTVRGDSITAPATTTTDPLTAIIDNTLSDQSAATVVVLAAGYVSIKYFYVSIKYLPIRDKYLPIRAKY